MSDPENKNKIELCSNINEENFSSGLENLLKLTEEENKAKSTTQFLSKQIKSEEKTINIYTDFAKNDRSKLIVPAKTMVAETISGDPFMMGHLVSKHGSAGGVTNIKTDIRRIETTKAPVFNIMKSAEGKNIYIDEKIPQHNIEKAEGIIKNNQIVIPKVNSKWGRSSRHGSMHMINTAERLMGDYISNNEYEIRNTTEENNKKKMEKIETYDKIMEMALESSSEGEDDNKEIDAKPINNKDIDDKDIFDERLYTLYETQRKKEIELTGKNDAAAVEREDELNPFVGDIFNSDTTATEAIAQKILTSSKLIGTNIAKSNKNKSEDDVVDNDFLTEIIKDSKTREENEIKRRGNNKFNKSNYKSNKQRSKNSNYNLEQTSNYNYKNINNNNKKSL